MPEPAKRVKIRRKDLRGPDEFETLTGQTLVWARDHRTVLIAVGVSLVLAFALALFVGRSRASRNQEAAREFEQAQARLASGDAAAAATQFAALSASAGSTPFGRLAGLYRGHALARQGDAGGAATAYTEYLAAGPAADFLRQQGLLGVGRAKEAIGDHAGALEAYTQAEELGGPLRTESALAAARVHESQGHADKARDIYLRLRKDVSEEWVRDLLEAKTPGVADAESVPAVDGGNVR